MPRDVSLDEIAQLVGINRAAGMKLTIQALSLRGQQSDPGQVGFYMGTLAGALAMAATIVDIPPEQIASALGYQEELDKLVEKVNQEPDEGIGG